MHLDKGSKVFVLLCQFKKLAAPLIRFEARLPSMNGMGLKLVPKLAVGKKLCTVFVGGWKINPCSKRIM
jgi:hypothetical protein